MENGNQHDVQYPVYTGGTTPADCQSGTPAIDGVSLYPQDFRACINGHFIELGPPLFRLLRQLINNRGHLLTRRQLLDSVWGHNVYIEERTLEAHIQRLRRILAPFKRADLIETVNGVGYRFREHRQLSTEETSS